MKVQHQENMFQLRNGLMYSLLILIQTKKFTPSHNVCNYSSFCMDYLIFFHVFLKYLFICKYTIRSIVCEASCHLVTRSFGHSIAWSLSHSVTQSLSHLVTRSLGHTATHSLGHSVTCWFGHSVTRSLGHLVTWSLGHLQCAQLRRGSPDWGRDATSLGYRGSERVGRRPKRSHKLK